MTQQVSFAESWTNKATKSLDKIKFIQLHFYFWSNFFVTCIIFQKKNTSFKSDTKGSSANLKKKKNQPRNTSANKRWTFPTHETIKIWNNYEISNPITPRNTASSRSWLPIKRRKNWSTMNVESCIPSSLSEITSC